MLKIITLVLGFFIVFGTSSAQNETTAFESLKNSWNEAKKYRNYSKIDSFLVSFDQFSNSKSTSTSNKITSLIEEANIHIIKKEYIIANTKLDLAHTLFKQENINNTALQHTLDYATIYVKIQLDTSKYENLAFEFFEKYKNKNNLDPYTEALMYEFLGRVHKDRAEYTTSISFLKKAITKFKELEYLGNVSIAYGVLGAVYDLTENYEQSAKAYELSITYNEKLASPNFDLLASTSFNISLLYGDRLQNAQKSIEYANQALTYDIKSGGDENPYLALDYGQLSNAYLAQNNIINSQIFAEKSLEHAKKFLQKQPFRIAEALRRLSTVNSKLGSFEKALQLSKESLAIVSQIAPENHRWTVSCYAQLADVYYEKGDYSNAEKYYIKTEKIAQSIKRDLFRVKAFDMLMEIYLKTNQVDKIPSIVASYQELINGKFNNSDFIKKSLKLQEIDYYIRTNQSDTAKSLVAQISDEDLLGYPLLQIKTAAFQVLADDILVPKTCYTFLETIVEIKNQFPNQVNKMVYNNSIRPLVARVLSKIYKTYNQTENVAYKQLFFKLMELNKNSVLLEGIQNTTLKSKAGISKQLLVFEQKLLDSLEKNSRRIYQIKQAKDIDNQKIQSLLDLQLRYATRYDSLQKSFEQSYPKLKSMKYLTLHKEINTYANTTQENNQAIIEYFIDDNFWYRFLITNDEIVLNQFNSSQELIQDTKHIITSINNKEFDKEKAAKLCKVLIPELNSKINRLIIIPDGYLNLLPFETLMFNTTYLVEKYAISYAGSLELLEQQKKLSIKGDNWLGFAPSYRDNTLPNNVNEVQQIQQVIGGTFFQGSDATKENFINESEHYSILHIAAHTEINQNNALYNKMLFSSDSLDGSLMASEIYGLELKANLAVLSSCNTGFGKLQKGEGIMSMSRAFTYAGVASTLMTLWEIPDKETVTITTNFYKNLKEGSTKDSALQNAKVTYLSNTEDEILREPFYWAGFIISGDVSPIESGIPWGYFMAAFVIAIAIGYRIFKNRKQTLN